MLYIPRVAAESEIIKELSDNTCIKLFLILQWQEAKF